MFTAYDELQDIIDINDITKITLDEIELEKEATFELMNVIELDEMIDGIVFWTSNSRIDKIVDYNDYDYDYGEVQICFKETKLTQKTAKLKIIPKSLTQLWKDPETGMNLPLKTKAYLDEEKKKEEIRQKEITRYKQEKYERAKNVIEKQLEETEEFEFEPFTIIEGGEFNRCRYITLPEEFPVPDTDYYLGGTPFYRHMKLTKKYVDFVGLAGMKNNKPCILFKYALNSLKDTKDLQDLVIDAIDKHKFTPVLGISQEIIGGKDLDDMIQEIKIELENKLNKQK